MGVHSSVRTCLVIDVDLQGVQVQHGLITDLLPVGKGDQPPGEAPPPPNDLDEHCADGDHPGMGRRFPTATVTFLFTDVEGSTRLLHELGAEPYAEALGEHRRVLRAVFAA